jgi:energy-coupling factor transporter ATP-binding protein EcfA2
MIYHRWSLIAAIGATLGKQYYLPFYNYRIFPNHYVLLIGNPGARKSTAIKTAKKLLARSGYNTFSADKTSKEQFLVDLEGREKRQADEIKEGKLPDYLLSSPEDSIPRECFIVADEFNVFLGRGNLDFIGDLGNFWDWDSESPFTKKLRNSSTVSIYQPTLSILGGTTHDSFAEAFPPESVGQGFLSRLILVYGEPTNKKISFPKPPPQALELEILNSFSRIKKDIRGEAKIAKEAELALDTIYKSWKDLEDFRFKYYSSRRFSHLLKLCLVVSACYYSTVVTIEHVLIANSILSYTESLMPKALGEFGKNKNHLAVSAVMELLYSASSPVSTHSILSRVGSHFSSQKELTQCLQKLIQESKIQYVSERGGFLPLQKAVESKRLYVDFNLLKEFTL